MRTNGGCRCFKRLEHWDDTNKRWTTEEVRKVQQDTQRLAGELRRTREALKVARDALQVATTHRPEDREVVVAAMRAVLAVLP